MPGICYVEQNLFLAYVIIIIIIGYLINMPVKRQYPQQWGPLPGNWLAACMADLMLCPIPGIGYGRQNLFLAYVMLNKTTYGT